MAVRFKLDENVPLEAQPLLLQAGYDTHTVRDERLAGHADAAILDACIAESRILITLDLDFPDIRQYPPSTHCGIWVLRPETQSIGKVLSVLKGALALVGNEPTEKRLWIVEPERVRIRD